jgi:hypothetical protein
MKIRRISSWSTLLLIVGALFLGGCVHSYPHSTPEKLGKTVFKILQKQDQPGLSMVIPTEKDLESFLATADMPEDELAAFRQEMKQIIAEFEASAVESFQKTSDLASKEGIVLSKAKIDEITFSSWQGPDNMLANITVKFKYGDQNHTLILEDAGKVTSGWVLGRKAFELAPPPPVLPR